MQKWHYKEKSSDTFFKNHYLARLAMRIWHDLTQTTLGQNSSPFLSTTSVSNSTTWLHTIALIANCASCGRYFSSRPGILDKLLFKKRLYLSSLSTILVLNELNAGNYQKPKRYSPDVCKLDLGNMVEAGGRTLK